MNYEHETILMKTFSGVTEEEIAAEYNLPDYLPDVSRLLKIRACVSESSHALSGDSLEYEGKLRFTVLYATSDGSLKSAEFERDFSGNAAVSGTSGDCDIRFEPVITAVTCRLQNPRKLTAKPKLTLHTEVYCLRDVTPDVTGKLTVDDEETVETLTAGIAGFVMVEATETHTPVSEDIDLDTALPAMEEITDVELTPYIHDIRAAEGKIIYKGEILAAILYLATKEETEPTGTAPKFVSFSAKIPISGEIDAPEATEKYIPVASVSVSSPEYRTQTNAFGENRTAEIDFDYSIAVTLYGNRETILTSDMYSTAYETEIETEALSYTSVLTAKSFNFTSDGTINADDSDFDAVVRTDAMASISKTEKEGNKLAFYGTVEGSVILTNGEGIYLSKPFSLPFRAETDGMGLPNAFDVRTDPTVLLATARMDGEHIRLGFEIFIAYTVFCKHTAEYVTHCAVNKDHPREPRPRTSLLLCYPAPNDTLWDIAKKYSTTTAALMAENGISAETTPRVLSVPMDPAPRGEGKRIML